MTLAEIAERFETAGLYEASIAWVRGSLLNDARGCFPNRAGWSEFYRENLHVDRSYVSRVCLVAAHLTEPQAKSLRWQSRAEAAARLIRDGHDALEVVAIANAVESCNALRAHFEGEKPEKVAKFLRCPKCGQDSNAEDFEPVK